MDCAPIMLSCQLKPIYFGIEMTCTHHYCVFLTRSHFIYPVCLVLPPLCEFTLQQLPDSSRGSKLLHYILGLVELFLCQQVLHAPQVHVQGVFQGGERQLRETLSSVGGRKTQQTLPDFTSTCKSLSLTCDTCIISVYQEKT